MAKAFFILKATTKNYFFRPFICHKPRRRQICSYDGFLKGTVCTVFVQYGHKLYWDHATGI